MWYSRYYTTHSSVIIAYQHVAVAGRARYVRTVVL